MYLTEMGYEGIDCSWMNTYFHHHILFDERTTKLYQRRFVSCRYNGYNLFCL